MIEKNDIFTAVTEGIGSNGEGIIRHEGITFFVPACLPGERVTVKVLKVKGNIGYGKAEEILTPAEERVRPKCPVFSIMNLRTMFSGFCFTFRKFSAS